MIINPNGVNKNSVVIDEKLKKRYQFKKMLRLIIGFIVLSLIIGGFFYWYETAIKNVKEQQKQEDEVKIPKLFGKEDYIIEDRADGKYIIIDKIGFSAKIPDGWKVEMKNTSYIDSNEYWAELLSSDANFDSLPKKGCKIDITSIKNEAGTKTIQNIIDQAKIGQYKNEETFFKDYQYSVIQIAGRDILESISPERPYLGQFIELDFINGQQGYTQIQVNFLPGYKEGCSSSWEDFVKSIIIK